MFDKILNGIIIVLIALCLFVGGKILYTNYMIECEEYNNNIVNFAVDLVKGYKSLEDIDNLDATEEVKNSMITYYRNNFYAEDELVLIYEDVAYFEKYKDEIDELQRSYGEDFLTDPEFLYGFAVNEGEELSEETKKFNNLMMTYSYIYKDELTKGIIKKDNNLYMNANDISFNGKDRVYIYYNGLQISLSHSDIGKMLRVDRQKHKYYQSFIEIGVIEDKKDSFYKYKNEISYADIILTLKCETSFYKIKNISIILDIKE